MEIVSKRPDCPVVPWNSSGGAGWAGWGVPRDQGLKADTPLVLLENPQPVTRHHHSFSFSLILTCSYLHLLILTCSYLFLLSLTYSYLFLFILTYSYLFSLILTCSHYSYYSYLFVFISTYSYLFFFFSYLVLLILT